jgi:hypothetical protein
MLNLYGAIVKPDHFMTHFIQTPLCDGAAAKPTVKCQHTRQTYAKHPHNLKRNHCVFQYGFDIKRYTPLQPISQLFPFQIMHGSLFFLSRKNFCAYLKFLETFSQQIVRDFARNYCENENFRFNPSSRSPMILGHFLYFLH